MSIIVYRNTDKCGFNSFKSVFKNDLKVGLRAIRHGFMNQEL